MIAGLEKDFDLASIDNASQKELETVKKMKSTSKAGAGLLKFVYAILSYNAVFREVKPKRDKARMRNLFSLFHVPTINLNPNSNRNKGGSTRKRVPRLDARVGQD